MLKKIEGFVLSETANGETSKILNILTKEYGLLGVIAKNVKSFKNPLRIKACRFTYATFHLDYYENKLSKLEDIDIIDNLSNVKKDLILLSYITYLSELTNQVVRQNYNFAIYDNFIDTILKINEGHNPQILTNILEIKYLDYLGVGLNLDCCIRCGSKKNIVTIDADEGGYICNNCYRNEIILSPKAIKLIRMYYYVKISSISKISINENIINEINNFLNRYYERYTGLYLQSKKFLDNLLKTP